MKNRSRTLSGMIGPMAAWELTRLARRGGPFWLKMLGAMFLFGVLSVYFLAAFPNLNGDINDPRYSAIVVGELARFGEEFTVVLLIVQAVLIIAFTPISVSSAIVEEIERKTLEFLLATDLSPREIVIGKTLPRMIQSVTIVLLGAPFLAAVNLWGGVDVVFAVSASLILLGSIWAVSGMSAAIAVGARSMRQAVVRSYVVCILFQTVFFIACPMLATLGLKEYVSEVMRQLSDGFEFDDLLVSNTGLMLGLALHLPTQFILGWLGFRRAIAKIQFARTVYAKKPPPPRRQHWEKHPPIPDHRPLLWKEIHLSGQTARVVRLLNLVPWPIWLSISSVVCVMVLGVFHDVDVIGTANDLVRYGGFGVTALMSLIAGMHAAGSVVREREQETLTDLLMIPGVREEILATKWWASLWKARNIAIGGVAMPLVGVIAEAVSVWMLPFLLLINLGCVALAASFGLWLSVHARTVRHASQRWLMVVLLFFIGTMLGSFAHHDAVEKESLARSWRRDEIQTSDLIYWDRMVNPALAWSDLTVRPMVSAGEQPHVFYYERSADRRWLMADDLIRYLPSVTAIAVLFLFSIAFYRIAVPRFRTNYR